MSVTSGLFAFQGVTIVVIWRCSVLRRVQAFVAFALVMSLAGCPGGSDTVGTSMPSAPHPAVGLRLEQVVTGLSFPVFATAPRNDPGNRLFILEKGGVIKIFLLDTMQLLPTPFLTVTGISAAGEQGLLGLAFHPNFETNGVFYVYVSNTIGDSEIRRYTVSANPNLANSASTPVITISQLMPDGNTRFTNHKAGWIDFGSDGFLYVALGDGGGAGDNFNNAQNINSLLGKILRLNMDMDAFPMDAARNYGIPAGNPFANVNGADEIWSLGLRNPWRPSFDRGTGDFYIADVGQGAREEVNVATATSGGGNGVNYGWKIMEGTSCFSPPCNVPDLTPPVLEYDHSNGACSITGGYVYRGNVIPALQGTYFYGDYCVGFVRSFRLAGGMPAEQSDWAELDPPNENITSFGEDAAGELYIVTQQGRIYRIVPN
jgi:glucose/arabinose dehydrogenase